MQMDVNTRWEIAQKSEKRFWDNYTKENLLGRFGPPYKNKARDLLNEWKKFIQIGANTKILQVGGAAWDVINCLEEGTRYALDPLAEYYKEKFSLDYSNVEFKKGVGEQVPYPDEFFDVVVLGNVLDHVSSPEKVLAEARRVLRKGGLLYLDTHIANRGFIEVSRIWGFLVRTITGKIFNVHHPYMFSKRKVQKMIKKNRFSVLSENIGKDYLESFANFKEFKLAKKTHEKKSIRFLAKLGFYGEIMYVSLCRKT